MLPTWAGQSYDKYIVISLFCPRGLNSGIGVMTQWLRHIGKITHLPGGVQIMQNSLNKRILALAFLVAASIFSIAAPAANASRVGPTLTQASAQAQTQAMLRYDTGVQNFLHLSTEAAQDVTVTKAVRFKCHVGIDKRYCPFNTYKSGTTVKQTSYRYGTWRWAYRVEYTYKTVTKKVTFHELSSNLLSGAKKVKAKKVKEGTKPVKLKLAIKVAAGVSVEKCGGTTVSASAQAQLKTVTVQVKASSKGWFELDSAIKAAASANITVKCDMPAATPAPVKLTCTQMGLVESSPGSGVCQAQSASSSQASTSDATVDNDCKGPNSNSSQCNTTINQTTIQNTTIIQVQGNCSKIIVTTGDGNETIHYKDLSTGASVNEEYCTVKTETPPITPAPTPTCPPGYAGTPPYCYSVKDGTPSAGTGNSGTPSTGQPGSGSTGTPASADCWALDGNNDPTIPGRWTNGTCVRI
jgi:hypothetical protein